MPDGGTLLIDTSVAVVAEAVHEEDLAPGRYLQVSVTDTGVGMDAATRKRLFEPFFTTKEVGKGTGLGLASVYGTVKNHGGTIRVSSEPGRGSTFSILLPLLEEPGARGAAPEEPAVADAGGHGRILIVDDEASILEVGSAMLRKHGYAVTACMDPGEALEVYRKEWHSIDLVVLDMVMPKMGGKELFLAMEAENPAIKAVLSSGYSINGDAQGILKLGVQAFVQKPFRRTELLQTVAEVLRKEESGKMNDER
jgi:CheY-like chemotaxis protein